MLSTNKKKHALRFSLALILVGLAGSGWAQYKCRITSFTNLGGTSQNENQKSYQAMGQNIVGTTSSGTLANHTGFLWLCDEIITPVEPDQTLLLPKEFKLHQNFPNPFNPTTTIKYDVPKPAFVNIKVYNIRGQRVAELVNEMMEPGFHAAIWDAAGLASGMYFYRIQADKFVSLKKMVIVK